MNFCRNCGSQVSPGIAFCGNCGTAVADPATSAASRPPLPPTQPPSTPSTPSTPSMVTPDQLKSVLTRILVGNWVGAGLVAGATLAATLLCSILVALLVKSEDLAWSDTLTLISTLAGGAFGGDAFLSTMFGDASVGAFPLGITMVAVSIGVLAFRKVTAAYTSASAALFDGLRAAFLVALPLFVIALVFRSRFSADDAGDDDAAARAARDFAQEFSQRFELTAGQSAFGTLLMTFVVLGAVFAVTVFMRADWLGPRLAKAHGWLAAPIAGVVTMILLLPVVGLIAILAVMLVGDGASGGDLNGTDEWMRAIGMLVAVLPNIGMAGMSLGAAGKVGASMDYSTNIKAVIDQAGGGPNEIWVRITKFTGDGEEPGLWILAVVVPVVLLACAYVVARRSGSLQVVFRNLLVWAGSMVVVVPWLARLANVHAGFDGDFSGLGRDLRSFLDVKQGDDFSVSAMAGLSGVSSTTMLTLGALAAALVIAALTGAINVAEIGAKASSVARRMQDQGSRTTPAQHEGWPPPQSTTPPAQAPTSPPPAGPPPNQPPY